MKNGMKVDAYGTKRWYLNGQLHREDGPAVEYLDESKSWWINSQLHRENGPAIEWKDGFKAWYLNGKKLSEEEFRTRRLKKNLEII